MDVFIRASVQFTVLSGFIELCFCVVHCSGFLLADGQLYKLVK